MIAETLKTATLSLQRNDPVGAIDALKQLPDEVQDDARVLFLRGLSHLSMGHVHAALEPLTLAHDQKPDDLLILQNLIAARLAVADICPAAEAIAQYEHVLELDAGNDRALLGLAQSLQEQCEFEDAAALYQAYLTLHPSDVAVLIGLGYCLQELRRPDEAHAAFDKVLTLDPAMRPLVLKSLSTASAGRISLTGYAPQDMLTF